MMSRGRPGLLPLLAALLSTALLTFTYLLLSLDRLQTDPKHPSSFPSAQFLRRRSSSSFPTAPEEPPDAAREEDEDALVINMRQDAAVLPSEGTRWLGYKDPIKQPKTYPHGGQQALKPPTEKCNCSTVLSTPMTTVEANYFPLGGSDYNQQHGLPPGDANQVGVGAAERRGRGGGGGNRGRHVNFFLPGQNPVPAVPPQQLLRGGGGSHGGGGGELEEESQIPTMEGEGGNYGEETRQGSLFQAGDLSGKIQRASRQLREVLRLLERIKGELNATAPLPTDMLVSARLRSGIQVVKQLISSLVPGDPDFRAAKTGETQDGAENKSNNRGGNRDARDRMKYDGWKGNDGRNRVRYREGIVGIAREEGAKGEVFCKETFRGTLFGYPFYEKGFLVDPCSEKTGFDRLLTAVFNFVDYPPHLVLDTSRLVRQFRAAHPEVAVLIATRHQESRHHVGLDVAFRLDVDVDDGAASRPAAVWKALLARVTTPYAFISRELLRFDGDAGLERLVREISQQGAGVVGGATRTADGRWSKGCYQVLHRNYTLVYRQGYRRSYHECVRCQYIRGPFVTRTSLLRNTPFDETLPTPTLFEDYFLTLSARGVVVASCPDAMFHVRYPDAGLLQHKTTWSALATKWRLNRVRLASGTLHVFTCREVRMDCAFTTGLAVAPCCLEQLAEQIKFIMRMCEEHHIVCELQEGTLLGAVKLGKVLPWERDGDITFLSANFSSLGALHGAFSTEGYVLEESGRTRCCVEDRLAGGVFTVRGASPTSGAGQRSPWTVEMYGYHRTDSETLLLQGLRPTKVFLHGAWVAAPRNPGRHLRNRYGHEIYRHAQHWISLGKYNGWDEYVPSGFSACPLPGRHDCLDNYPVDGNLQFEEPQA